MIRSGALSGSASTSKFGAGLPGARTTPVIFCRVLSTLTQSFCRVGDEVVDPAHRVAVRPLERGYPLLEPLRLGARAVGAVRDTSDRSQSDHDQDDRGATSHGTGRPTVPPDLPKARVAHALTDARRCGESLFQPAYTVNPMVTSRRNVIPLSFRSEPAVARRAEACEEQRRAA